MATQEADYGLTDMAFGGNNARYADDDKLLVKFFKHPHLNDLKSAEEGRPCYEEKDYIQIMQPGNKDSIVIRPATRMDLDRFAQHYQRYKQREDDEYIEGTLLEEWPGITRSLCEELKFFNIRTVEQLAEGISDSNAQNIMGISMMRDRAKAYLEAAADEAAAEAKLAAERRAADLEEKLGLALARIEALEAEAEEEE